MYAPLVLLLVGIAIVLVALLGGRFGVYEEMLDLIRILVWPAVVMSALIFFRRAFTYLLFSIEEINVFGAKSRLKNVKEVIDERAKEIVEREKREQESKHRIEELEASLRRLKERTKNKDRIAELANELIQENAELWDIVHRNDEQNARRTQAAEPVDISARLGMLEHEVSRIKEKEGAK